MGKKLFFTLAERMIQKALADKVRKANAIEHGLQGRGM
jgi:hypothetical protein